MVLQSMKMAWKAITSNKMRTFLTMLGIIIGVFALDVLVSLVSGATGSITDSINSLGTNMVSVMIMDDHDRPIRLSDFDEIKEACPGIDEIAPVGSGTVTVTGSYLSETASVTGTTYAYAEIEGKNVQYGRFIMQPDVDNNVNVAVIDQNLAEDMTGSADATGTTIRLNGREFTVIGVLEESDTTSTSIMGSEYEIYIPYTSLIRLSDTAGSSISSFYISAVNEDTDTAEQQLNDFLMARFSQDEDAFTMINMSSIADVISSVTDTLSLLLGGIAGISLLVGGIGIMNIMLVSVTERTREIGIRKAIGAGRKTIMMQFLIEALTVSVLGSIVGIILSEIALLVIDAIGDVSYQLAPGVVLFSVVFSIGIGVLFGLYPANKAAKMKPIDALRF